MCTSFYLYLVNGHKAQIQDRTVKVGNHVTFCTCIRTEQVRELFIIFLILNEFSCIKVEVPCLYSQCWNIYVILCYAMYFSTQAPARTSICCSSLCGEIQPA